MSDEASTSEIPQSKPPIRFCYLRIAVSVFFGVLTVALVVLWVRSYTWRDVYLGPQLGSGNLVIGATNGHVTAGVMPPPSYLDAGIFTEPAADAFVPPIYFALHYSGFVVPHWFLALVLIGFALAPWAKYLGPAVSKFFSLRTMLIVTTLVAVVLGLAVWMVR